MEIRPARPEDGEAFVELVQCLAEFEELAPPSEEAKTRLIADAFAEPAKYQLWVAELEGRIVAYAAWFQTYSTFRAKATLYLEDLFVHPEARRRGVARAMLSALQARAEELGCGRFEWSVLDWNVGAKALYQEVGARPLEGWQMMRIDLGGE